VSTHKRSNQSSQGGKDQADRFDFFGQDAGLIDSIKLAGEIIEGMVTEAEEIIKERLNRLLQKNQ